MGPMNWLYICNRVSRVEPYVVAQGLIDSADLNGGRIETADVDLNVVYSELTFNTKQININSKMYKL